MSIERYIPEGAVLIPKEARRVFGGIIFDIYQWEQKQFDGSKKRFEMARRPDSVAIVAIHDNKILTISLLQPGWSSPRVTLPGGRVDDGETTRGAAQREMLEETGLTLANWKLVRARQPEIRIEWFQYLYVATEMIAQSDPIIDVGEEISLKWVDLSEIPRDRSSMRFDLLEGFEAIQDLIDREDLESKSEE